MSDRILVVEDDPSSRAALAALLAEQGFEVDTAADAAEALARFAARRPALVISDVLMPRGGGLGLVRRLRDHAGAADTPIILVSALGDSERRARGLELGADDYLAKPVDPRELIARVRLHLRRARRAVDLARRAVIDPLTGLLNRGGIVAVLHRELERTARSGEGLSVLLVDIDHFKYVNDAYGHKAGDTALRLTGRALSDAVRVADHVGRFGGDEFVVVVPGGAAAVAAVEERLGRMPLTRLGVAAQEEVAIRCSVGAATFTPGETLDALLDRADAAMYAAKQAWRAAGTPHAPTNEAGGGMDAFTNLTIRAHGVDLAATLALPEGARGLVVIVHGSRYNGFSDRDRVMAAAFRARGLGTLSVDLLTHDEAQVEEVDSCIRCDVTALAQRVMAVHAWTRTSREVAHLGVGCFAQGTAAAAALAAVARGAAFDALVCCCARTDLAEGSLSSVTAPTLLLVGGDDRGGLESNRRDVLALAHGRLVVVPDAGRHFEAAGALAQAARLAAEWFATDLIRQPTESRRALGDAIC